MKTEIKIILEEGSSNKAKGNCFETLIRNLLAIHQYDIRGNINFSGMEIDLIANHKHKDEILYVECKAKEKVSSDELSKFCFNVEFQEADYGYFFRTQELEYQAGALLSEIRKKAKYKNLTFFEPSDIIQMLSDANKIFEPISKLNSFTISKKILAITHFGDFLIYLVDEANLFPTKFIVVNANNNSLEVKKETVELILKRIDELSKLEAITNFIEPIKKNELIKKEVVVETISEVQESEYWYDYLPASSTKNHFVGRDFIRTQILDFFKEVQTDKTHKRIFYLNGKSGWGKSSLLLEIKSRCENKYYKNKFFTLAIDTRSALSDNFVALSFEKLINKAIEKKFIKKTIFSKQVKFTSNLDLLSSESIEDLFQSLKAENKYLVLIFDQFEDVFRKQDLFKSFYKFLSDVTDKKPNLIVGFSWKSEFFIPNDDPAYYYWQQAKEQSREFIIGDFGEKEIDGIIKQLEQSIGKLDKDIKNRIKESSQGLPWLTKKLCIHIFEQIQGGLKKDKLIESNLNIIDLFEKDKERIEPEELNGLKLIAQKAYEGAFFEISEVGESIESKIIDSLLNKRLIIKSGANYNIYWDIFRDYLVTNIIPTIGESYLIRQRVTLCLEVFLLFKDSAEPQTIETILKKHIKSIGKTSLENILIELRNFGLIKKNDDFYSVAKKEIEITENGFITFITHKFQNYTPYLELKKMNLNSITKDDITTVLKSIFKQDFKDKTWEAYSLNLISWFLQSKLDIKPKIKEPQKGRSTKTQLSLKSDNVIPRSSLKEISSVIKLMKEADYSINSKYYRDLLLLNIIDENKNITAIGSQIIELKDENLKISLIKQLNKNKKIIELQKILKLKPKIQAKELVKNLPTDFFDGKAESSKIIYASVALSWVK